MARRSRRSAHPILSSIVLAAALAPAHGAELGEPKVSSHIGQPLVADIELTMIDDPSAPVQVRLASPEVYNGAGIAVPAVLSTLNLSVMRRDGRQFLHATTLRNVDAEHLHVYLELVDKGQRAVRLATLWLTPDPNPAPPPLRVPAPVAKAPAPAAVPVRSEPKRPRPEPAPAPAPRLPLAGVHGNARPPCCMRQVEDARACVALGEKNAELRAQLGRLEEKVKGLQAALGATSRPAQANDAAAKRAEAPAQAGAAAGSPPADKPARKAAAQAADNASHGGAAPGADAVPGHEEKAAPHAKPGAGSDAGADAGGDVKPPPAPETRPAAPKPIHAIKPLVPRKHKEPAPEEGGGMPWGWIGGAAVLLAGLGAGGVALARRGRTPNVDIPDPPGLFDKLKARFASRTRPGPGAGGGTREAEPSLD